MTNAPRPTPPASWQAGRDWPVTPPFHAHWAGQSQPLPATPNPPVQTKQVCKRCHCMFVCMRVCVRILCWLFIVLFCVKFFLLFLCASLDFSRAKKIWKSSAVEHSLLKKVFVCEYEIKCAFFYFVLHAFWRFTYVEWQTSILFGVAQHCHGVGYKTWASNLYYTCVYWKR